MVYISYVAMLAVISIAWIAVRAFFAIKNGRIDLKREVQLLLVYVCIVVIVRFTFCPFGKVDGRIQPLVFDIEKMLPPRVNLLPLVNLLDYESVGEAVLNVVGNTLMFVPVGIVFPSVYRRLDTHLKIIGAGVGFSLAIEILQLPFYGRVSDVDDLILNSLGFVLGYGIYLLARRIAKKRKEAGRWIDT